MRGDKERLVWHQSVRGKNSWKNKKSDRKDNHDGDDGDDTGRSSLVRCATKLITLATKTTQLPRAPSIRWLTSRLWRESLVLLSVECRNFTSTSGRASTSASGDDSTRRRSVAVSTWRLLHMLRDQGLPFRRRVLHWFHVLVPLAHHVGSYHFNLHSWIEPLPFHLEQIISAVFGFLDWDTDFLRLFSGFAFQKILNSLRSSFTSNFQRFFRDLGESSIPVPLPCTSGLAWDSQPLGPGRNCTESGANQVWMEMATFITMIIVIVFSIYNLIIILIARITLITLIERKILVMFY